MTNKVILNVNKDNFQKRLSFNNPDRKNKSNNSQKLSKKYLKRMLKYYSDPDKAPINFQDFLKREIQPNSNYVNLVIGWDAKIKKPIFATKKDLKKIYEKNCKYIENSNLNQFVVSFDNSFIEKNITIEKLYEDMARKLLPNFLKDLGYDPKKISYQFSLHADTDNLHFHVAFMEKQPAYKSGYKKQLQYKRKLCLDNEVIKHFKASIHRQVEMEKYYIPLAKDLSSEIENLKINISNHDLILDNVKQFRVEEKFVRLGKLLYLERQLKNKNARIKIKYGSIKNKEIIQLTEELAKDLFLNDQFNIKKDFETAAKNFSKYLNEINNQYNILNASDGKIVREKSNEFDKTLFNQLINVAFYDYKEQENLQKNNKKFLHELAYQNYKETKYKNKQLILQYFIDKRNKYFEFPDAYKTSKSANKFNCPNLNQLFNKLEQMQFKRSMEIKKIQEAMMENWYDKTKY